jgi:hypothetical protein
VSDDWRLRIHLPGGSRGRRMAENLEAAELEHVLQEALSERVAVSHDEDDVFVYAATRQDAEGAGRLVGTVAAQKGWEIHTELTRWHPVAEEWEEPDKPLPSNPEQLAEERSERIQQEREEFRERGYPDFEVRVQCRSRNDALELQARLRSQGIPTLRRWHYLLVGAPDEDAAAALAERIRAEAPPGAVITTEGTGQAAIAVRPGNPFAVFGGMGG